MTTSITISLIGLALSIIGASWKICEKLTANTDAVKALTERMDRTESTNEKEHNEMWDKIETHDDSISDHETRLQLLEHKED